MLSITKSDLFYCKLHQCSFGWIFFLQNQTTIHRAGYSYKGTSTLSQICLSKLLNRIRRAKIGRKLENRWMSKNCVTRSYTDNLLKFRMEFCTPSKVKCKRSKPQEFFFFAIFFAAASFSLNNNICLFVFSECFQIIHWSLLDQKPLQFQHIITY